MDPKESEKLKQVLLTEKALIEKELAHFANKDPHVKGNYESIMPQVDSSDTLDEKAHSVTDFDQEIAIEHNLELRLKEINETLTKIESGTYGVCDTCGQQIQQKRLEIKPAARFCIDCAKKATLL